MSRPTWRRWLAALATLSATVLVHEVAHAVAARRAGGRVREVGIGFGPRLVSRRVGETTLSLRPLLVGGFAAIDIEDLPPARRVPVLLAGPLANILVGLALMPRRVDPRAARQLLGMRAPGIQLAGIVGAMGMLLRAGDPGTLRYLAAHLNLSVGLANLLPLVPLDGGHLVLAKMEATGVPPAGRDLYRQISAALFLWMVLQVLLSDLRRLGTGR